MWTSTLELEPRRVLLARLLGLVWRGACFSSFAPLQVQNLPRQPLPASNWVRVRNRLAGICGSDLHLIYADGDFRVAPAALPGHRHSYPGHEVVGEVIEIGEDVQRLRVGDRVVLQYGPNCASTGAEPPCQSCAAGNYNLCERGTLPGPRPIGGGWSEEMLLHEQQLFPISSEMSDAQAVLLEPTAVALHAVLRRLPQAGERVLIIGAGTIGLLTLQIVRALAPMAEVSILPRHAFQVEQATRMGAAHIIYPHDSYVSVQRITNGQLYHGLLGNKMVLGGYDVIYDTIGHNKTLHDALRWTRAHATVVLVGLHLHMMHIDLTPIWYREIDLVGTMGHGKENWPAGADEQSSTFSVAQDLIERGQIHPEQLITHHFALDNYRNALTIASGKARSRAIKVVFDYSLLPVTVVPNVRASARRRSPIRVLSESLRSVTRPLIASRASQPLQEGGNLPVTPQPLISTDDSVQDEDTMPVSRTPVPVTQEEEQTAETTPDAAVLSQHQEEASPVAIDLQKVEPVPAEMETPMPEAVMAVAEAVPVEVAVAVEPPVQGGEEPSAEAVGAATEPVPSEMETPMPEAVMLVAEAVPVEVETPVQGVREEEEPSMEAVAAATEPVPAEMETPMPEVREQSAEESKPATETVPAEVEMLVQGGQEQDTEESVPAAEIQAVGESSVEASEPVTEIREVEERSAEVAAPLPEIYEAAEQQPDIVTEPALEVHLTDEQIAESLNPEMEREVIETNGASQALKHTGTEKTSSSQQRARSRTRKKKV
ncbi:MAG: alcohol dehydrogenase catalytic domain-containing protein [Chloroflexi bacterium]|nr:alcohol dehydrogenase catalytic domain-containing protein [Chloroflexota bacterium]